ncbi:SCP-like protein [Teladorsagia circumcincta]|uniref:SCP-like protein n=1 Tax=Teladorsagia circumcincta TaxID=45464 RepID=A0A2G9TL62_TELCI|nr:SCP-like protein [Teladorsagia circumcincta]
MLVLITFIYLVLTVASGNAGASCSLNNGMTDEVRQMFVDKHNQYRSLVAKGLAVNPIGGFAPKAARMLKVSYDCKVEENMMAWAKRCKFEHSSFAERNYWGQNLYMTSWLNMNKTKAAAASVDDWFSELKSHGVPQDNILTMKVFDSGVGHYSQVAWESSNKIGCAVEWCPDMTFVGCEYNPTGNWLGEQIYEKGEPCKTNADCKCAGCTCSVEEALCVAP